MALIDKASLLMVPSTYEAGTLYNVLPSGNRAPDSTDQNSGYDQTRADFTFDRGSNAAATRVNSDGLIEKYRENLLTYSNDFSNAAWDKNIISITSGQADKDGGTTASRLTANSGGQFRRLQQTTNIDAVVTASIFVKAGTANFLYMVHSSGSYSSGGYQFFDVANGTLGASSFLKIIDSSIEDAGNGWYRCTLVSEPDTAGIFYIGISNNDTNTNVNNGLYVDIQSAQLEQGLVATDVLTSGATTAKAGVLIDLPRINYDANGENGSLLLEPSRQQLIQYSEYLNGSSWTLNNVIITDNATTSPEGVTNASKWAATSGFSLKSLYEVPTCANGVAHTATAYFKADEYPLAFIRLGGISGSPYVLYDLRDESLVGTSSLTSHDIESVGNGWYRIEATATTTTTIIAPNLAFLPSSGYTLNVNNIPEYTGDGTSGGFIYGAQVEAGSYVSSYIPNHGTSGGVTRAADSCSVTGVSDVIGQSEGTIFLDIQTPDAIQSNTTFSIGGGTSSEYAQLEIRTDLSINWRYRVGGTDYINANVGSYSAGDRLKLAFGYKNGDSILYLNGSSIATDTGSITSNSWDEVKYSNFANTGKLEASVYETILFTERLTNSELATLTTL